MPLSVRNFDQGAPGKHVKIYKARRLTSIAQQVIAVKKWQLLQEYYAAKALDINNVFNSTGNKQILVALMKARSLTYLSHMASSYSLVRTKDYYTTPRKVHYSRRITRFDV